MGYANIAQERFYKLQVTGKELEPVECTIIVHSHLGFKRANMVEELVRTTVTVSSRQEAIEVASEILRNTSNAATAWFDMPNYWNHNLRSGYGKR